MSLSYQNDTRSRDSSVVTATGYEMDDREIGVRVPVGSRNFFLNVVHTGSGTHTASYTMGTGALSSSVKRSEREIDSSPSTSAEVKKT
jgi:hypothetical protein